MKFTTTWADLASQNISLKIAVIFLSLTSMSFGVSVIKLATKDPLIIDRACVTKTVVPGTTARSQQEIEAFIKEALPQRFDMDTNHETFLLSEEEKSNRTQEEKDLKSREMKQRVVLNTIKVDGATVQVDTDRLLSIGQVRSVVSFPRSMFKEMALLV